MVNNPPANQLFGTCLEMPGCDRISELPDHLLTHILSYLPTKDSGKTSVLSKRWKNLWLSVPVLDVSRWEFHYGEDNVILSVVDRLLEFDTATRLLEVKVNYFSLKIDGLKDRISTVIKRGPQHLEYESCTYYIDGPDDETYPYVDFMPLNLYTSKTLVSLKLKFSGLEDPGFVCMPCLKSMTLAEVRFREDVILEKLVSGCPVLEELTLARDMDSSLVGEVDRFMRVRSGSLKRFCVPYWHGNDCNTLAKCTLEIDAPRLERMVFEEDQFDSILVKNLTSLFMVDLNISFHHYFCPPCDLSQKENFRDFFLSGISSVRHMIISKKTMEALDYYSYDCSIPKFINLSRLDVVVPCNSLQFLSAFLECCPNLKHLILEVHYLREMDYRFELTRVPKSTSNGVTHHWSP